MKHSWGVRETERHYLESSCPRGMLNTVFHSSYYYIVENYFVPLVVSSSCINPAFSACLQGSRYVLISLLRQPSSLQHLGHHVYHVTMVLISCTLCFEVIDKCEHANTLNLLYGKPAKPNFEHISMLMLAVTSLLALLPVPESHQIFTSSGGS